MIIIGYWVPRGLWVSMLRLDSLGCIHNVTATIWVGRATVRWTGPAGSQCTQHRRGGGMRGNYRIRIVGKKIVGRRSLRILKKKKIISEGILPNLPNKMRKFFVRMLKK